MKELFRTFFSFYSEIRAHCDQKPKSIYLSSLLTKKMCHRVMWGWIFLMHVSTHTTQTNRPYPAWLCPRPPVQSGASAALAPTAVWASRCSGGEPLWETAALRGDDGGDAPPTPDGEMRGMVGGQGNKGGWQKGRKKERKRGRKRKTESGSGPEGESVKPNEE